MEENRMLGRKLKEPGVRGGLGKDTKDQEDSFSFLRTAPLADVCKIRQRVDSRKLNHLGVISLELILQAVGSVGFPVAVATYPLVRIEGKLRPDRGHRQADEALAACGGRKSRSS